MDILPYAVAAAIAAPAAAVLTALILAKSANPLVGALAYVAGAALLDLVLSAGLLWLLDSSGASGDSDVGAAIDIVLGAVFLTLGLFAVFKPETPAADAARRARAEQMATAGIPTLLVAGVVVQIVNFDALAAFAGGLKQIAAASLSTGETLGVLLAALLVMLVPYWGPAAYFAVDREGSRRWLAALSEWILGHMRALEIVVGFGFGVAFAAKGIGAL